MNYITNNISEFLSYRINMAVTKTDNTKLLHDGGTYTITYADKLAQSVNANLVFTDSIGLIENFYTVCFFDTFG